MKKCLLPLILIAGIFFNIVRNDAIIVGVRPKEAEMMP